MKRLQGILVVLLALSALVLFFPGHSLCQTPAPNGQAAAQAVNAFALDLYGELRKQEGNIFFSPYSVSAALAMAYTGAAGKTESQMAKTLHFSLGQAKTNEAFRTLNEQVLAAGHGKGAELNIANALWAEKSFAFKKEFLESVRTNFAQQSGWFSRIPVINVALGAIWSDDQGSLRQVDFRNAPEAARNTINSWVEQQTDNKIKDLFGPGSIAADTKLVITNAIYFKGFWESQFKKNRTKDDPFYLLDGTKVTIPMMMQTASFGYAEETGLQVLEMGYKGGELAMVVLLPSKERRFDDFEQSLTAEKVNQWIGNLKNRLVDVHFPKYEMTSSVQLPALLTKLGMTDAFSLRNADFSGMTGGRDLFIEKGIHKAFVHVYEEGTEAAAATGWSFRYTGAPPRPVVFRADHPFVFLIRHKPSGCILFLGRVTKP